MRKKILLTALIVGMLAAGCSAAATPDPPAGTGEPVVSITASAPGMSSSLPAGTPDASTSPGPGFPHADGPIPGFTADSIVRAWAARWHADPTPYAQLGTYGARLTIDFPAAHGKLAMAVNRVGAGAAAANTITCEVTDASLGLTGYPALTRKAVEQLVADCPGPALRAAEAEQVVDYVAGHDKPDKAVPCNIAATGGTCRSSDHRTDLERFRLAVLTGPGHVTMYLLGRKGAA